MQLHVVYKTLSSSIMMVYVETPPRRLKPPYIIYNKKVEQGYRLQAWEAKINFITIEINLGTLRETTYDVYNYLK